MSNNTTLIQDQMMELKAVESELKEVNARAKELRSRKKDLQGSITEWLLETDRPGCMYEDLIVLRSQKTTHTRLKKKEKQARIIDALEEQGIANAPELYNIMIQASIGDEQKQTGLKIKLAGS